MQTLMIKDLSRNDELTIEEMKTIAGGWFAFAFSPNSENAEAVIKAVGTLVQQA